MYALLGRGALEVIAVAFGQEDEEDVQTDESGGYPRETVEHFPIPVSWSGKAPVRGG
ncbi:hypothetical protein PHLCEN_2v6907 [Hermanssonia centrifuga]|uniref:Uncharacterized protein n=1 Tax=Hermanssonia centrifuga TaxID=98765 RepID=A0A2R6NXV6_9APHY|nr:hypothetical protein PHLCEN_2v6907 [Hermanssonia centrifuga]